MGQPAVVFPDIAEVGIDIIRAGFTANDVTAAVGNVLPSSAAGAFVLVRRQGGPRRDLVTDTGQLRVEATAATRAEAHDVAQIARALLHAAAGTVVDGTTVYRVDELGGPQELPDPTSNRPRYLFTVLVTVRGRSL